jgi:hypothetical protein
MLTSAITGINNQQHQCRKEDSAPQPLKRYVA